MTNNTVLRRLRYIFDYSDAQMAAIFGNAGAEVAITQISAWLRKEEDEQYEECRDRDLALFLNGLIVERRGKKDGPLPEPETNLTNNNILVKLKIALNLHAEDVQSLIDLGGMQISKHELSALFRKPGNRHYRECKDQLLRTFLNGMQSKFAPS